MYSYVSFLIATADADTVAARHYPTGKTNDIAYDTMSVAEGAAESSWRFYVSQKARRYSFAVRKNGVWSAWPDFTEVSVQQ